MQPQRSLPSTLFAGISCVSAALLIVELALTRLFSVTMFYHFAFLAISVALFGLSASGVFIYLTPKLHAPERLRPQLRRYAMAFCLVTVVSTMALMVLEIPDDRSLAGIATMLLVYVTAAAPFFFAGACLTLAISRLHHEIGRVYAFDLAGGAAGCMILIWALNHFGGPGTLFFAALLGAAAAVLFSLSDEAVARKAPLVRTAALIAIIPAALIVVGLAVPGLDVVRSKGSWQGKPLFSRWNSFSRVAVYRDKGPEWGVSEAYAGPHPDSYNLDIDCSAATPIIKAKDLPDVEMLRWELTALGYRVLKRGSEALVIGPGGGRDLWSALLFNVRKVSGVEINSIIAEDVMSDRFRDISGNIYHREGVSVTVDDGRSFVRRSKERYDLIQATLVDTWAATAAGAFALSENNLYTVEAFLDYFHHLKPDGILTMTRWDRPEDGLRLLSLARSAGERLGWPNLGGHLFIARQKRRPNSPAAPLCTYLFKRSAFTDVELTQLKAASAELRFDVLYPSSGEQLSEADRTYGRIATTADLEALRAHAASDLSATTDDRPFFFQSTRPRDLWHTISERGALSGVGVLPTLTMLSTVLVVVGILLPLLVARRRGDARGQLPSAMLGYFACLGAGYMLIEIGLMQRFVLFLGHPVYSLTVVLFTLLLGSGIGSALSRRTKIETTLRVVLPLVILLGPLYSMMLPPLFTWLIGLERPLRIAISCLLLLPLGVLLGMPLPAGVRMAANRDEERLAWAWAINGATSVLGASVAMTIAVLFGFTVVAWCGAGVYATALLIGIRLRRTSRESASIPDGGRPAHGS